MRILLTGASGQIGGRLHRLLAAEHDVLAPSRAELDLADTAGLKAAVRDAAPHLVINAAAWTDVEAAEDDPGAVEINAVAPGVLAAECARRGAALIHFSTDYVHDGRAPRPYSETDRPRPLNAYGRGKLAGDLAVLAAGAPALILRLSWIYDATGRNFLRKIVQAMQERDTVRVVADQRGAPTPAGIVADVVARIVARAHGDPAVLFAQPSSPPSRVVNLACRGSTTWHGFASAIMSEAKQRGADLRARRIDPITTAEYRGRAIRPANSRMRLVELRRRFGVTPPHWRAALRELFAADAARILATEDDAASAAGDIATRKGLSQRRDDRVPAVTG